MSTLFTPEFPSQGDTMVRLQRFSTSSTYSQVIAAGFLNAELELGHNVTAYDFLMVSFSGGKGIFQASTDNDGIVTLSPVVMSNSVPQTLSASVSSATPGTVRALDGEMSGSASVMSSGNLVGVRGAVTYVGASGGSVYGTQGKLVASGTLSGSSIGAGLFGQLDLSAATVNAGQLAPVWADCGATTGTLTDKTGVRMFAGTNSITGLTLNAMDYRYGKALSLFELAGDAGTYITTGAATPSGTMKKIHITIDGAAFYILAAAVWS